MGWFVVHTKAQQEHIACEHLRRQGYCVLAPEVSVRKRRRGVWQSVIEPMFPGYVFVSLELGKDDLGPIAATRGCRGLVKFGSVAAELPTSVLARLKDAAAAPQDLHHRFGKGDTVRFEAGPFEGLSAIVDMPSGKDRAIVLISLLGRLHRLSARVQDLSGD